MKKIYIVRHYDSGATLKVEIDYSHVITRTDDQYSPTDAIKEMVDFWMSSKEDLFDSNGDYTEAFLKNLHREALLTHLEYNYNTVGIIHSFEDKEGWYPMDGSMGIKIVEFTEPTLFENNDFKVEEL